MKKLLTIMLSASLLMTCVMPATAATSTIQVEKVEETSYNTGTVSPAEVVKYARSFCGKTPYVYGGSSLTTGTDCGGFVVLIFKKFGINLSQYRTKLRKLPSSIAKDIGTDITKAKPGDIIICNNNGHVGIFSGGKKYISALNSKVGTTEGTWVGSGITHIMRLNALYQEDKPEPVPTPIQPTEQNTVKEVKLSQNELIYTGKTIQPEIKAYNKNGRLIPATNYTVTFPKNSKSVGTYDVKIVFKNGYSGTKTLSYKIVPRGTSIVSFTATSNSITVKYNKQASQTSGYEIMYGTDKKSSNGKKVKVNSNSTARKKITGLKAGTKYYFKVRTYKTVGSKKYYSNWSSIKSFETKKAESNKPSNDINDYDLSFDAISKRVTVGGKELSKYTYDDLKDYLISHYSEYAEPSGTGRDVDFIRKDSKGNRLSLGFYQGDWRVRVYLENGGWIQIEEFSNMRTVSYWYFDKSAPYYGVGTNVWPIENSDIKVKSFITVFGHKMLDSLASGLSELVSIKDGVKPIKEIKIKDGKIVSQIIPASAGGELRFEYNNGNSITIETLSAYFKNSKIVFEIIK